MYVFRPGLLAVLLAVGVGCASSDTALLPESERAIVLDRSYEEAFVSVSEVLRAGGYEIDSSSVETGLLRTDYRSDDRIENMSSSAWSQVEAVLTEVEGGTRVLFTVRARYSTASPNFRVGFSEMPRDDQRTVLEDLKVRLRTED